MGSWHSINESVWCYFGIIQYKSNTKPTLRLSVHGSLAMNRFGVTLGWFNIKLLHEFTFQNPQLGELIKYHNVGNSLLWAKSPNQFNSMKIYLNISYLEEEMNSDSALKTVQPSFFTIQSMGQLHTVDNLSLLPISNYEGKKLDIILDTIEHNKQKHLPSSIPCQVSRYFLAWVCPFILCKRLKHTI